MRARACRQRKRRKNKKKIRGIERHIETYRVTDMKGEILCLMEERTRQVERVGETRERKRERLCVCVRERGRGREGEREFSNGT